MLIITASDNNYVAGVLVLIASAAFHNPTARFAVLDMGISVENRARIDRLAAEQKISIQRIEISPDLFAKLPVKNKHLNHSTYLRLLIPDIFPDEERVIYMDCDMVVMDDLSSLDTVALDGKPIAAVPCPSPNMRDVEETGHKFGTYVNAGLLVMNLPLWRAQDISGQCIAVLTDPDRHIISEDQSAINIVCKGRTTLLPSRFNTYAHFGAYKKIDDLPPDPAVIHYVVSKKPWHWPTLLDDVWKFHAGRIAAFMPPGKPMTIKEKLRVLVRKSKQKIGTLIGSKRYLLQRDIEKRMKNEISAHYIAQVSQS